jgi:hypothetical protein
MRRTKADNKRVNMVASKGGNEAPPMPDALPGHEHLGEYFDRVAPKVDTNRDGVLQKEELLRHLQGAKQRMGGKQPTLDFLENEYTDLLAFGDSNSNGQLEVNELKEAVDSGKISGFIAHVLVHDEIETLKIEL